nr:hypothetical protein [uncultured Comamonas sp.]
MNRLVKAPEGFKPVWPRAVDGAAEFARSRLKELPLPAIWVIRSSDKAHDKGERAIWAGPEFDVVIAIENARQHARGETDEILLAYRRAVFHLLEGWESGPGQDPIKYQGGKVIEYTEGDLYWSDRYRFGGLVTNYLGDPPAFDQLVYMGEKL